MGDQLTRGRSKLTHQQGDKLAEWDELTGWGWEGDKLTGGQGSLLQKSAVQQSFVDLLTSPIFVRLFVQLSPW